MRHTPQTLPGPGHTGRRHPTPWAAPPPVARAVSAAARLLPLVALLGGITSAAAGAAETPACPVTERELLVPFEELHLLLESDTHG